MKRHTLFIAFALAACHRQATQPANQRRIHTNAATVAAAAPAPAARVPAKPAPENDAGWPPAPGTPGGLPDDRRPLPEMHRDMTGPQGAAAALETYVVNVAGKHWTRAHQLWGDDASAIAFERRWRDAAEVHGLIGTPGDAEGGCGSIYAEVPVQFYGTRHDGSRFNSIGTAMMRRVNDVDGATARQLRWHVDRITLKDTH